MIIRLQEQSDFGLHCLHAILSKRLVYGILLLIKTFTLYREGPG